MNTLSSKLGHLVVIEGADGIGKSTQLELLRQKFVALGHTVTTYDFPHKSDSKLGELIGEFLKGNFGEVTPEFLALAFSLDRLESKERLLTDLQSGNIVLCDRYVSSNVAFQTSKIDDIARRHRLKELLIWLEYELFKLPKPNFEIILTATETYFAEGHHRERDKDIKRSYLGDKVTDIHEEAHTLQIRVNDFYSECKDSDYIKKISILDESSKRIPANEIHSKILSACRLI